MIAAIEKEEEGAFEIRILFHAIFLQVLEITFYLMAARVAHNLDRYYESCRIIMCLI